MSVERDALGFCKLKVSGYEGESGDPIAEKEIFLPHVPICYCF